MYKAIFCQAVNLHSEVRKNLAFDLSPEQHNNQWPGLLLNVPQDKYFMGPFDKSETSLVQRKGVRSYKSEVAQ